jgi:hypothetical protein
MSSPLAELSPIAVSVKIHFRKNHPMSFDPIQERRNRKYTREELDSIFKGSGTKLQEFKEQNPTLYKEYRRDYEALGGIGKSRQPNPAPNTPYKPPTRTFTPEELVARGQYSETEIRAFFNSKEANEVFTSEPKRV